jgi:hypothetical protein
VILRFQRYAPAVIFTALLASAISGANAQEMRRLNAGLLPVFYVFDNDYFDIDSGGGADLVLKYEIRQNVFFENRLGGYAARQGDHNVTGFNGQLGISAFLPVWIPWRPSARIALALMTADPVISDPIQEFRPSQTVFYIVAGVGITRSINAAFQIEAGVDLLFTPYSYRVYEFYRQYVEVNEVRFTQVALYLGASYTF